MLWGNQQSLVPLPKTDLCALVKGLLYTLMTHFGLGSSMGEEPLGCLLGKAEGLASWELALLVALGTLAWEEPNWEASPSWEIALSANGVLPAWELPAWELLFWEACKALSLAECLTTGVAWGMPTWKTSPSAWERVLSAWEAWGQHSPPEEECCLPGKPGRWCFLPEEDCCLLGKPAWLLPEG